MFLILYKHIPTNVLFTWILLQDYKKIPLAMASPRSEGFRKSPYTRDLRPRTKALVIVLIRGIYEEFSSYLPWYAYPIPKFFVVATFKDYWKLQYKCTGLGEVDGKVQGQRAQGGPQALQAPTRQLYTWNQRHVQVSEIFCLVRLITVRGCLAYSTHKCKRRLITNVKVLRLTTYRNGNWSLHIKVTLTL